MKRFKKNIIELGFNPENGITDIRDAQGDTGIKFNSYIAVYASKDGKNTYKTAEALYREDLSKTLETWQKDMPKNRIILLYQSENYAFPGRVETDMALVKMVPDLYFRQKICLGYWSDRNVPSED